MNYRITENDTSIYGIVGTNAEYAAVHEYGFRGVVTVREHLRMMKVAFGRQVKNPRKITVRQHPMNMNMPERSFLRSSLKDFTPQIQAGYEAAMKRATK